MGNLDILVDATQSRSSHTVCVALFAANVENLHAPRRSCANTLRLFYRSEANLAAQVDGIVAFNAGWARLEPPCSPDVFGLTETTSNASGRGPAGA